MRNYLKLAAAFAILLIGGIWCSEGRGNGCSSYHSVATTYAGISIKTSVLHVILSLAVFFSFLTTHAQGDDLSVAAKNLLEQISKVQKDLSAGKAFSDSSPEASWIGRATTAAERERFYERFEPTERERQKFDEALNTLAAAISNQGGSVKKPVPVAFKFSLDEISRITKQVSAYDPKRSIYLVNLEDGEWLLRAVSKFARDRWAVEFFKSTTSGKEDFWKALDELSAIAATKIPVYKPSNDNFKFHNAPEEKLMKAQIAGTEVTIHKLGLSEENWQIAKNSLDIPISRFKRGYAWIKGKGDDYTYCHLYQINLIQDYSGSGKYGATYARFLGDWLIGCP